MVVPMLFVHLPTPAMAGQMAEAIQCPDLGFRWLVVAMLC